MNTDVCDMYDDDSAYESALRFFRGDVEEAPFGLPIGYADDDEAYESALRYFL